MSPQLRSSETLAGAANDPDCVGNGSPCVPLLPTPQVPKPGAKPTANQPPTSSPKVTATTTPPRKAAFVRWRIRPSPIPIRISGQSCQKFRTTSALTRPDWTASGTAPATMKKTPQPSSPRLTCTRFTSGPTAWPIDMIDPPGRRWRGSIVAVIGSVCPARR